MAWKIQDFISSKETDNVHFRPDNFFVRSVFFFMKNRRVLFVYAKRKAGKLADTVNIVWDKLTNRT